MLTSTVKPGVAQKSTVPTTGLSDGGLFGTHATRKRRQPFEAIACRKPRCSSCTEAESLPTSAYLPLRHGMMATCVASLVRVVAFNSTASSLLYSCRFRSYVNRQEPSKLVRGPWSEARQIERCCCVEEQHTSDPSHVPNSLCDFKYHPNEMSAGQHPPHHGQNGSCAEDAHPSTKVMV